MAVEYIGEDGPDGMVVGARSTSKLGFFGLATPIAKPSATGANATSIGNALEALGLITQT